MHNLVLSVQQANELRVCSSIIMNIHAVNMQWPLTLSTVNLSD